MSRLATALRASVAALLLTATITSGAVVCKDHRGQGREFRMLQPDNMDLIMHGAGQDPASFRQYWDFMPNSTKPMVFMTYLGLNATSKADVTRTFANLEAECASYGDDRYIIPQIGLSMTHGAGKGYDGAVAAGQLDEQIGWLADALATTLKRPAYVRIGYEFNGALLPLFTDEPSLLFCLACYIAPLPCPSTP